MRPRSSWLGDQQLWLELFVIINLGFLSLDIYLAHSVNLFRRPAEYVPLYFSIVSPIVLVLGLASKKAFGSEAVWRDLGHLIGWLSILIGTAGVVLHLESRFFDERTLKSLVYAAPFAAPLAYTGLGLLLIMNRLVPADSIEWPQWVLFLALGGFVGNFIFSITDHAQNAFFYESEWVPVTSSALAVGFLAAIYVTTVGRAYLWICAFVLAVQAAVGVVGFYFHIRADLAGPSSRWFDNVINGAPPMAPLLFPNLVLLASIGLWAYTPFVRDN